MIELKDLTLGEYFDLEDKSEYNFAMKFAFRFKTPKDEFDLKDIGEMPFGIIKDYQYLAETGQLNMMHEVTFLCDLTEKESLGNEKLDKVCRALNWLGEEISKTIEVERIALAYEPTDIEQQAGMDLFDGLGVFIQIDSLAGGDPLKYEGIRKLPYHTCFAKMVFNKRNTEYQRNYNRLMIERQKNNL